MKTCLWVFDVDSAHYGRVPPTRWWKRPSAGAGRPPESCSQWGRGGGFQWLLTLRRQVYHSNVGVWRQPSSDCELPTLAKLSCNERETWWDMLPPEGLVQAGNEELVSSTPGSLQHGVGTTLCFSAFKGETLANSHYCWFQPRLKAFLLPGWPQSPKSPEPLLLLQQTLWRNMIPSDASVRDSRLTKCTTLAL